ncbi:acetate/propionate family kinase [Acetobacter orientalis]|uniref:Acetate kinase n=1 Tax=Acetobacter orientalis TaxID=146474 RepID=A0A2Z5ZJY0_9PROT|nr:acetate/propionate family kinase [Acetobacter orientalis]BBC80796.1 acetate kinase [Acetobacter orientalis]GAN66379.1 acetate kinase [Acetobacter orientalis]GBR14601.1 acetate kinase [Acetobacter orientalis NRIC 0481]GEL62409.1 acetate kinase [Acetobacter orientalis]
MHDGVVVFNSGSSSLKFRIYDKAASQQATVLVKGEIEHTPNGARFCAQNHDGTVLAQEDWPQTGLAIYDQLFQWLEHFTPKGRVVAVGHRIVHGGADFLKPVKITPDVLDKLERLTPFDPLHQQATLAPAKAIAQKWPGLVQVACFDTTFHSTIPKIARLLPLPRRYQAQGIVRYGFHGISYSYIAKCLTQLDPTLATGRTIIAHLGSGASLCALKAGKSLETTMGFSALDGLMMGTRCGAIDPGVLLYMVQEEGADWHTLVQTLYHDSGLLGVSGISPDMRILRALRAKNPTSEQSARITEALSLFVYRIVQEIGALTAVMGGLDGLVFTAGIGEHDHMLRQEVCQALSWAGVVLDTTANQQHAALISASQSRVSVRVIPTDEEREIYLSTLALL